MANFRPLQPAPTDEQNPPQHQSRPSLTQKPKRTVTLGACVPCRKRKSKCDGLRPLCTCCVQKDTECVYELWPNEKPSQAMKRKNEEMQAELTDLREIYDFLRMRPEREAQDLLLRIRTPRTSSPSSNLVQRLSELAVAIRHGDLDLPHSLRLSPQSRSTESHASEQLTLPPIRLTLDTTAFANNGVAGSLSTFPNHILSSSTNEPVARHRRHDSDSETSTRFSSIDSGPASRPITNLSSDKITHQLPLPPLTSIEAILTTPSESGQVEWLDKRFSAVKRWTTVTADANLLAHLLSSWHAREYSYYHFWDWDIFLDDMASGRTDFCSRLLVNALLASASFQSSLVKDTAKPMADNVLNRFYKEARRLWEEEEGQDTIPRLQSALLLFLVLSKHGKDKIGHSFLLEACRIAHSLGLFTLSSSTSARKPNHISLEIWDKARSVTAWGLFNFQLSMTFTYSFPTIITTQPPLAIPYDESPQTEALFRSECGRHVIMLECARSLSDDDGLYSEVPPKPEQLEVLYLRLKAWWQNRPEGVNAMNHPTAENILAAMQYHAFIVHLMNPFLNHHSTLERVISYRERACDITASSLKILRHLITLHEVRHGWSHCIPYVLHAINVAGFGTLEELSQMDFTHHRIENIEQYQGLVSCLKALSILSNSVYFTQPIYRLLTQSCETTGIPLPIEAKSTLDYYRTQEWTQNAIKNISSQYIADMRIKATAVTNKQMDAVVKSWEES